MLNMNFSEALRRLKLGAKLNRKAWPKNYYIEINDNNNGIKLHTGTRDYQVCEYVPETIDILASDWIDPAE